MTDIALSLVSHTNVGKTTLARTLLGRDVGEVRDEAHVTLEPDRFVLVESAAGDALALWDTPGFGDSVRLARRLALAGNPLGWLLTEVWDRLRDRPFYSNQRAVRNVLDHADAVLYLVNASEAPDDTGYLDPELRVLELVGKPVIVLLNQLGPPRPAAQEAAELERWRARVRAATVVKDVLPLDAFARCWVQEGELLRAVARVLPTGQQAAFTRLREAWDARQAARWHDAMAELARRVSQAALDREPVEDEGLGGRIQEVGALLGLRREGAATPRERAMQALAARLDAAIRDSTDRLIALHGLEGRATAVVLERLAEHYAVNEPVSEAKAAVLGGVLSGALAGLKADLATGGLTMGGGLLAGGVLGALGAMGVARGVNKVMGAQRPMVAWSDGVLDELVRSALLGYLAVIHYGRGRGDWQAGEHPAFWREAVEQAVAPQRDELAALWRRREPDSLQRGLQRMFADTSATLLAGLYPGAERPVLSLASTGSPT